jgi:hypothetical protein
MALICYNTHMTVNPNDPSTKYQVPDHKHQTQSIRQIWAPLIVVLLVMVGSFSAMLILSGSSATDPGRIQNAAIILLILPMALIGLVVFIALGLAIAGTSRLMQIVPHLRSISMKLDSITATITTWSNRIMLPFVIGDRFRSKLSFGKKKTLKQQALD